MAENARLFLAKVKAGLITSTRISNPTYIVREHDDFYRPDE